MQQDKPRCAWAKSPLMQAYHDMEWGRPTCDDGQLYEMLLLEAFQAGLSWQVILSKRENFRHAFDGFDPHKIAAYDEAKIAKLLEDAGIVRCRRKIRRRWSMRVVFWKFNVSSAASQITCTALPAARWSPGAVSGARHRRLAMPSAAI